MNGATGTWILVFVILIYAKVDGLTWQTAFDNLLVFACLVGTAVGIAVAVWLLAKLTRFCFRVLKAVRA